MSRDYIPASDVPEDVAISLRRIADALERIADPERQPPESQERSRMLEVRSELDRELHQIGALSRGQHLVLTNDGHIQVKGTGLEV